jgi:hypothetical protein
MFARYTQQQSILTSFIQVCGYNVQNLVNGTASSATFTYSDTNLFRCFAICNEQTSCVLVVLNEASSTCYLYNYGSFQFLIASPKTNVWKKKINGLVFFINSLIRSELIYFLFTF